MKANNFKIIPYQKHYRNQLIHLFDLYRIFYKQKSDIKGATLFIYARLKNKDSVIFLCVLDDKAIGFTQLYPTLSSVSMERYHVLNDLYVSQEYRGSGAATALLLYCQEWSKQHGYKGLSLETASDNPAQKLYERLGWSQDSHSLHYFWTA